MLPITVTKQKNVVGKPETQQIMAVFKAISTATWQSFINNRLPILNLSTDVLELTFR
ncbi:MAG: hypothetical protein RLZZ490_1859, partial [Cyanobacteriota bacterium]